MCPRNTEEGLDVRGYMEYFQARQDLVRISGRLYFALDLDAKVVLGDRLKEGVAKRKRLPGTYECLEDPKCRWLGSNLAPDHKAEPHAHVIRKNSNVQLYLVSYVPHIFFLISANCRRAASAGWRWGLGRASGRCGGIVGSRRALATVVQQRGKM